MLEVTEGQDPSYYKFRPTVPFLCPSNWEEYSCGCALQIEVWEQEPTDAPCPDGKKFMRQTKTKSDLKPTTCGTEFLEVSF